MLQALRDDYLSSHCLNCCVWPYESGEVIVQVGLLLTSTHEEAADRQAAPAVAGVWGP